MFIALIRYLPKSLILRSFLVRLRYSFLFLFHLHVFDGVGLLLLLLLFSFTLGSLLSFSRFLSKTSTEGR